MKKPVEIEFRDVTKRFGSAVVCDRISFSVEKGSVHGIVGENGAGKSTLMKMLYGLYRPDGGEIRVRGETVALARPQDAIRLLIGMVHQHFMLVPTLSVWRNIILGHEESFQIRESSVFDELEALKAAYGFTVDLNVRVENLPVGEQQQVEILKLLYRKAKILILDEPTAVLTPQEVDLLFSRLAGLSRQGTTIILISHKLREVLSLCDNVTVLRGGKAITTEKREHLDKDSLARLIVGSDMPVLHRTEKPPGAVYLRARNICLVRNKHLRLQNISFELRRGEILGVAGVSGNGQEELVEVISGVENAYTGNLTLDGKEIRSLALYPLKQTGLAVIPSDRLHEAAILSFPVWENAILGHHREAHLYDHGLLSQARAVAHSLRLLERFDVRPREPSLKFGRLSGGNQQKLVIGRETEKDVDLLVAAYPTRGVDIGAIAAIHAHFLSLRERNSAVILFSSELDEILALSDRILVLFEGRIAGLCDRKDADERRLGLWMTGCQA